MLSKGTRILTVVIEQQPQLLLTRGIKLAAEAGNQTRNPKTRVERDKEKLATKSCGLGRKVTDRLPKPGRIGEHAAAEAPERRPRASRGSVGGGSGGGGGRRSGNGGGAGARSGCGGGRRSGSGGGVSGGDSGGGGIGIIRELRRAASLSALHRADGGKLVREETEAFARRLVRPE